jgi:hypothetical protein
VKHSKYGKNFGTIYFYVAEIHNIGIWKFID